MIPPPVIDILSLVILAGIPLGTIAFFMVRARRSNYSWGQYLLLAYGYLTARVLWRAPLPEPLPIEAGRGAIIVCNHRGPFDPMFIQLATNRLAHWMVAREYCTDPKFAWFFRTLGCIPVGRGGIDTAATKTAIRLAEQGELIGMFPEGRLNTTSELLLPGRPGAALMALKARVPVIPCYAAGTPCAKTLAVTAFQPARASLKVGRPIDLSEFYGRENDRTVLDELTLRFLKEIARLAGDDEFEPRLAGRRWKPE